MKLTKKSLLSMLFIAGLILIFFLIMQPLTILRLGSSIVMLFPDGYIAREERDLLFIIQALMLLVILPVYVLTFVFSWKYSAENPKGVYDPDLVDNVIAEYIWWGIPLVMTLIIAGITWVKTYELDPFKPIASDHKPIKIQVVALQWKWLFIYPEEKIATVNFFQFPKNTPIHFETTADAPMNSFWIPGLGGQIYSMPSMVTQLHLIADKADDFRGSSANISGEGFSGMHFIARSSTEEDYKKWIASAKESSQSLNFETYDKTLALPSLNNPVETYTLSDETLFSQIVMKYMHPKGN